MCVMCDICGFKFGMSRSKYPIYIDENTISNVVIEGLRALGFRIELIPKGMKDNIILDKVAKKIFITENIQHFKSDISGYEIGLIGVPASLNVNLRAKRISDAIVQYSLWSREKPWYLRLGIDKGHNKLSDVRGA